MNEANHRHVRLLRAQCERPRDRCRTGNYFDEISPAHLSPKLGTTPVFGSKSNRLRRISKGCLVGRDVRFGPKADIRAAKRHVRFGPKADITSTRSPYRRERVAMAGSSHLASLRFSS